MKTSILRILFVLGLFAPASVMAAEFRSGDKVRLTDDTPLSGNVYVGGGDVTIDSPIKGDLFIGGGNIRVQGAVEGDLFIGGGNITVEGPVKGDARISGGNIVLSGPIEGEVMIGGGSVEIQSEAKVGELWVGAGQLTIAGTTGTVVAGVGQLRLDDSAVIEGDLKYASEQDADVSSGATVTGEFKRIIPPGAGDKDKPLAAILGGGAIWFLSNFLMLWLFLYGLPHKAQAMSQEWRAQFGTNLLWGFVSLLVTPILIGLLFMTVLGIPLAIGILLMFIVVLYLSNLVAVMAVGVWLKSMLMKDSKADWVAALIGLLVMTVLGFVPVIGWLLSCIAFLAGLGTLVRHDWALYKRLIASKEF